MPFCGCCSKKKPVAELFRPLLMRNARVTLHPEPLDSAEGVAWGKRFIRCYQKLQSVFRENQFALSTILRDVGDIPEPSKHMVMQFKTIYDQEFAIAFNLENQDVLFPCMDEHYFDEPRDTSSRAKSVRLLHQDFEDDLTEVLRPFSWDHWQVGGSFQPESFAWMNQAFSADPDSGHDLCLSSEAENGQVTVLNLRTLERHCFSRPTPSTMPKEQSQT